MAREGTAPSAPTLETGQKWRPYTVSDQPSRTKAKTCDGLKPQPRRYIDISEAPDRVREIYELVCPTSGTCMPTA